jgi:uncharacterized membrane protein
MERGSDVRRLALGALFVAATVVATKIQVPVPAYRIYFNLGEAVIYIAAIYGGPRMGAIAGALGAGLAEALGVYSFWTPITIVIKGVEGFVVGRLSQNGSSIKAVIAGAAVMIAGYAIAVWIIVGWVAVPMEILIDIAQTGIGGLLAIPVARRLKKTKS